MKKIITIVGARPQFIKASSISRVIRENYSERIEEVIVHTGQHFDDNMSRVFFDELNIARPRFNLQIAGGNRGAMTGRMIEAIEKVLIENKPDLVLIYGDTNSTLAGALAAVKLHIPIAHVEAGLRSFNMQMPEEINRILSDRVSNLLLCPTVTAVDNLIGEGITNGVSLVGDVMYDVSLHYRDIARQRSNVLYRLGLIEGNYVLATCHRAENTDDPKRLREIVFALADIATKQPVVLPLHPRTAKILADQGLIAILKDLSIVAPLAFLDMIRLEQSASLIVTDSGGVQKEAFFYGIPCITMRDETEWQETLELGWNQLVGANRKQILAALSDTCNQRTRNAKPYGDGDAAEKILKIIESFFEKTTE